MLIQSVVLHFSKQGDMFYHWQHLKTLNPMNRKRATVLGIFATKLSPVLMMKWPEKGRLNWVRWDPLSHFNWIPFPREISNKDFNKDIPSLCVLQYSWSTNRSIITGISDENQWWNCNSHALITIACNQRIALASCYEVNILHSQFCLSLHKFPRFTCRWDNMWQRDLLLIHSKVVLNEHFIKQPRKRYV